MLKFTLSPEGRAAIAHRMEHVERCYGMTDRWLAEDLLRLARAVRLQAPWLMPYDPTYDASLLFHVIPEVARRLGARRFLSNERRDAEIVMLSDPELRKRAAYALGNMSAALYGHSHEARVLLGTPVNGNALAIALDRLYFQVGDDDALSRQIRNIAALRGVESDGRWSPDMMKSRVATVRESGIPDELACVPHI